ncbi:MAG: SAM-dependent methyltransferase [Desulfovibrio sp.]|nr:MAG: SAM-dependent methyltransferase [Desulfovibrio sp.]
MDHRNMDDFATRVTFARAWNTHAPEGERICNDSLALAFLSPEHQAAATTSQGRQTLEASWNDLERSLIAYVAVRTRVMDMFFAQALGAGMEQIVILGAGFDSRGYRLVSGTDRITVFEVDQPHMQENKKAALSQALGELPEHVRYVPVDFAAHDLGRELAKAGYSSTAATACILEGVSFFLAPDLADRVFGFLARAGGAGSMAAFDYVSSRILDKTSQEPFADLFIQYLAAMGEPYRFGLAPESLATFAGEQGLTLSANRSALQWRDHYSEYGGARLNPPGFFHIAQTLRT